jgi:hypothetical protein
VAAPKPPPPADAPKAEVAAPKPPAPAAGAAPKPPNADLVAPKPPAAAGWPNAPPPPPKRPAGRSRRLLAARSRWPLHRSRRSAPPHQSHWSAPPRRIRHSPPRQSHRWRARRRTRRNLPRRAWLRRRLQTKLRILLQQVARSRRPPARSRRPPAQRRAWRRSCCRTWGPTVRGGRCRKYLACLCQRRSVGFTHFTIHHTACVRHRAQSVAWARRWLTTTRRCPGMPPRVDRWTGGQRPLGAGRASPSGKRQGGGEYHRLGFTCPPHSHCGHSLNERKKERSSHARFPQANPL